MRSTTRWTNARDFVRLGRKNYDPNRSIVWSGQVGRRAFRRALPCLFAFERLLSREGANLARDFGYRVIGAARVNVANDSLLVDDERCRHF